MVSCARATRGLRRPSLDTLSGRPSSPPSRENRREVVVRRAHARINQATLEKEVRDWEDARGWERLGLPVWPVSLVPPVSHVSRQRIYARSEGKSV